jgi:hypothetical protein
MVYTDNHLITLNSKYAQQLNGTKLSQCIFGFTGLLQDEEDIINTFITITNAQIPVSFYTITTSNNTLNFTSGSSSYTLNISIGNYNSNSLISALVNGFSSLGISPVPSISINAINGKLLFTSSSLITFLSSSSIKSILGFINNVAIISTVELPFPLNLLGVKKLSIKSDALAISAYSSYNFSTSNTLTTIPVDEPPFNMISYINQSDINTNILQSRTLNIIDISIVDENNNLIDFNNCDWSISLCLSIHRKNELSNKIDLIKMLSLIKESSNVQEVKPNISQIPDTLDEELKLLTL